MLPQVFRSGAEAFAIATVLYSSVALGAQDDTTDKVDILDYVDPLIGTANGGALSSELSAAPMK
jgi:hypothetical protein